MQIHRGILKAAISGTVLVAMAGAALAAPAVATANVNVRSGPSSGYDAVDVLQRGERVDVEGCRGGWCYVEKRGLNGWVSWQYLADLGRPTRPSVEFQFNFGRPPSFNPPRRPGNNRPDWNNGYDRPDWRGNDRDRPDWRGNDRDRPDWRGDDDRPEWSDNGQGRPGDQGNNSDGRPGNGEIPRQGNGGPIARPGIANDPAPCVPGMQGWPICQ
ncbi:SH3 domain-containing protein [uncultured Devosia sp.]|uniref:SH3 domain-containing protein n=1 Tax=uncultured Devosia sp. TaxID=211434 RepID=UPI0035CC730B